MKDCKYTFVSLIIISIIIVTGCSDFKAGVPIPEDIEKIQLSSIHNNINSFKDKKILLVGNYSGLCGAGCCKDFILKQGIESIKVDPNSIAVPGLKMGIPLKVYGIVKTTKTSPFIMALSIEEI